MLKFCFYFLNHWAWKNDFLAVPEHVKHLRGVFEAKTWKLLECILKRGSKMWGQWTCLKIVGQIPRALKAFLTLIRYLFLVNPVFLYGRWEFGTQVYSVGLLYGEMTSVPLLRQPLEIWGDQLLCFAIDIAKADSLQKPICNWWQHLL